MSLVFAAAVVLVSAQCATLMVGHFVFRALLGILLGACAGAGTATPALAAIREVAKSSVPTPGYGEVPWETYFSLFGARSSCFCWLETGVGTGQVLVSFVDVGQCIVRHSSYYFSVAIGSVGRDVAISGLGNGIGSVGGGYALRGVPLRPGYR